MNKIFQIKTCPMCNSPLKLKITAHYTSYICQTLFHNEEFSHPHYELMYSVETSSLTLRIFQEGMFLQTFSTSDYTRLYFAPDSMNDFHSMETIPPDTNPKAHRFIVELPYKDISELYLLINRAKKLMPFID